MPGVLERLVERRGISNRGRAPVSFGDRPAYAPGTVSTSQAYYRNATINAGLRLLARQVAEPMFRGKRYRKGRSAAKRQANIWRSQGIQNAAGAKHVDRLLVANAFVEQIDDHPLVNLLNDPNPFMTGDELWGLSVILDQWLAGNAYVLKARSELGNVAELWRLRPDRVKVIADSQQFIAGYEYKVGNQSWTFPREDVIHIKTLNPDDPYYGTPLLLPVLDALTVERDMKEYIKGFYRSGGAGPGAILTVNGRLTKEGREELYAEKARRFSGPTGAHQWLILDNTTTSFQSLGLDRGLAAGIPKEVSDVISAELSMAMGIPGSILGQLIGYESSSYANKRADWQVLWDITLTPQMEQLDNAINKAFLDPKEPEFGGIDEVFSDLSSIPALAEDLEAIQERHRKNWSVGLEGRREARLGLGLDPEYLDDEFLIPTTGVVVRGERLGEEPPEPDAFNAELLAHLNADVTVEAPKQLAAPKVGRPRLEDDPQARAIWEEAVPMLAGGKSFEVVAGLLGVHERTLRRYRDAFSG